MSHSESNPQNTTSTATSLTTKNLNVSGNSGPALIAEGGSSVSTNTNNNTTNYTVSTDNGAVASATALSSHALDTVAAVNGASLDLAKTSISAADTAYGNAANIINGLFSQFGADLQKNADNNNTQLGNVVSALTSSFESNNVSASQQAIQGTTSIVKYVAIAAIGGVAIYMLLRKQ